MLRPMVDMDGAEYQAQLRGREMWRRHGLNAKDMIWAEDALKRLEEKLPFDPFTEKERADFLKVKAIYARVFGAAKTETSASHTTTHYIWRTLQDEKVRPEHAANNGKIFAWDTPPETGHPGEDFGCRCWAEPYKAEDRALQEQSSQIVTFAKSDILPSWTREDFFNHYDHEKGKAVRLFEIGHLKNIRG
jgi:SPP1 gp7 family putative phage head morphogenesis protein